MKEVGEVWQRLKILKAHLHDCRGVVLCEMHGTRQAVVEVGEGNAVLVADGRADDDLVDVVELIPVLIADTVVCV